MSDDPTIKVVQADEEAGWQPASSRTGGQEKVLWETVGSSRVALLRHAAGETLEAAPSGMAYCLRGRLRGTNVDEIGPGDLLTVQGVPVTLDIVEPSLLLAIQPTADAAGPVPRSEADVSPEFRIGTRLLHANELVNIWEVQLDPGTEVPWHIHRYPYVVITVRGGSARIVNRVTGDEFSVQGVAGNVTYDSPGVHHKLMNVGETEIFDRLIEFKAAPASIRPPRFQVRLDPPGEPGKR